MQCMQPCVFHRRRGVDEAEGESFPFTAVGSALSPLDNTIDCEEYEDDHRTKKYLECQHLHLHHNTCPDDAAVDLESQFGEAVVQLPPTTSPIEEVVITLDDIIIAPDMDRRSTPSLKEISRRIVHWLNLIVLDASARTFKVGDCAGNTPRTFSSFGDRHATDQCVIDHEKEATLLPDIHALVSEFARISPKGHLKNDVSFNRQTSVLFLPAQTRYGCCMRFLQCVQSPIHVAYS
ncbi:hypothetical protein F5J12DRAFT_784961 [Pisolithus orientalis]|uniref:uncharacterized protein n=1 Tax=Pisolithus orientalis TaxID=936130 RepID=UPI0022251B89|nr:uncharacterized protein F5J12DRAFT_784961 [Pisolithus orientalis]KAI5998384.1 hypothetical protein F5J12DRAFT_784961 [Pisolithus orientalis]